MALFDTQKFFENRDEEESLEAVGLGLYQVPAPPPKGSAIGPVFRQNNLVASALSNRLLTFNRQSAPDPTFNYLQHIPQGHGPYANRYINAQNQDDINDIRWQIESELRDKAIIGQNPVQSFFLGFAANALDPSILFPGSLAYKGVMAEYTAAQRALSYGGAAVVGSTFSEVGLHSSQLTREIEESTLNILSSAIIGSALGVGAGKFLNSVEGRQATQQTNDILKYGYIDPPGYSPMPKGPDAPKTPPSSPQGLTPPGGIVPYQEKGGKSVSSASVIGMAFPGQTLAMGERTAKVFGSTLANLTPMNRLFTSPFYYARKASELLFENNYQFKKNLSMMQEIASGEMIEQGYIQNEVALETRIKKDLGESDLLMMKLDNEYFKQAGIDPSSLAKIERDYLFGKGLSVDEFRLAVYENYRDNTLTGIKEIDASVNLIKEYFDNWKEKLISIGKLDPNTKRIVAENYYTRYYDIPWIKQNRGQAYTRVRGFIEATNNALAIDKPYIDVINKDMVKAKRALSKIEELTQEYEDLKGAFFAKEELATKIFSAIVHKNQGDINKLLDKWEKQNSLTTEQISELEESLRQELFNLQIINELDAAGRPIKDSDLRKLRNIEKKLSDAKAKRDALVLELEDKIEGLEELVAKRTDPKAAEKLKLARQELKYIKKIEDKNIKLLEKQLEDFRSSFTPEKIVQASKIATLKERIKGAKEIGDLKAKYADKDITAKASEFKKILKKEGARLYRHRERLAYLDEYLKKNDINLAKSHVDELQARLDEFNPAYFDSEGRLRKLLEDDDEIHLVSENTLDNILGLGDDRYSNQFMKRLGLTNPEPVNKLVFLIPDAELGPMLLRDFGKVIPKFAKSIVPYYHINKAAEEFGFGDEGLQSGLLGRLLQEYKERAEGADPQAARDLDKARASAESDIIAGFQLLLGTYGNGANMNTGGFGKMTKVMAAWNYTRMMGYMTISAITDPGAVVLKHGYTGFVHDGIMPIIKSLVGAKHNKDLLMSMGRSLNIYNGYRLKSFMDEEGNVDATGGFEKFFNYAVTRMGNITLMNQWTDLMQWVSGNASVNRTLKYIVQGFETGQIPKKEKERFASLGLSDDAQKQIYDQYKKLEAQGAAGIDDGVYWMDFTKWDMSTYEGIKSYEMFSAVLLKDIDTTIVTAGLGDKPLFARTPFGQMMLQFKNFGFASTNRILISGLQRNDAEFYQGTMLSLALGALGYVITGLLKNRDIDLSAENLAFEAIDRSGMLGIIMEVPLTLQKMGLLPGVGTSRYHSRNWAGALGGPTLGTVNDIVTILNKIKSAGEEPLTTKDVSKAFSLLPWNNVWYFDGLNKNLGLVEGLGESLGAEEA